MSMKRTVPLVIYRDGVRTVIGEAELEETPEGLIAKSTISDENVIKLLGHEDKVSLGFDYFQKQTQDSVSAQWIHPSHTMRSSYDVPSFCGECWACGCHLQEKLNHECRPETRYESSDPTVGHER